MKAFIAPKKVYTLSADFLIPAEIIKWSVKFHDRLCCLKCYSCTVQLNKSHFYPFYPITAGFRDPVASTSTATPKKIAD